MAIRALGNRIIVRMDDTNDILIHELNDYRYRNNGIVESIGEKVKTNISIGEQVFFADMSGIHVDKKNNRRLVAIEEADLLFSSDEEDVFVEEELSFYGEVELNIEVII